MKRWTRLRVLAAIGALLLTTFAAPATASAALAPAADCQIPAGGPGETGPIDHTIYPEALGTVKALMVFVDFPDAPAAGAVADTADVFDGAADWLKTVSYGKEKPLCTEHDEDCWAKNRRAEVNVADGGHNKRKSKQ